jgi:hypothetical protein
MDLFSRRYSLTIGDTKITGLKGEGLQIQFRVSKSTQKDPNTAEIKVTNLSGDTRARLQGKGKPVILAVGYGDQESVIFSGDSRTILHTRTGPTWLTAIKSGDGEKAFALNKIHKSYAAGTPVSQVLRDAVGALAVNAGNLESALAKTPRKGLTTFTRGYTASGDAGEVVASLAKSLGLNMSIQNGALQFLDSAGTAPGQAVLLTPDTGLIGSPAFSTPEKEKKGQGLKLIAKSLLQPEIVCGGQVEIRSESVKGHFKVEHLEHSGDFRGAEWYTTIEAKAL